MTQIVSPQTAEHYKWGGPQGEDCDGWHLVRTPDLSVIEELMPPGTSEVQHLHLHSRQFFYVLAGVVTIDVEQHSFVLHAGTGLEVSPGQRHRVFNRGTNPTRLLVTSQPPSHGDRVNT
ncbi:cupin domain-containing protein [Tunturiibacter gelidoferens]|uniref:Mannose-6-phosphate isomerase-like protein (Cupin superfamily) n=1 Tax=Tunturiibacter gelidiferens TaxID=3069689 RepID=A0ACC5NZ01_9BACT|nr:cupin domain-containing protein [Edaphobacter lichenicola]MBB5339818.1 mannose-6-phosphate isomerase-like protein (cupin superfamily) [Edaphobacter lichenicola]